MIMGHLAQRISYNALGHEEYIGYAEPGKKETEESWQIRKIIYDNSKRFISMLYVKGSYDFRFKWSERTTYGYK